MSIPSGNATSGSIGAASTNDSGKNPSATDSAYTQDYHAQTAVLNQRRLCEQLREDARRERVKVSIVCQDLIRYITDHQSTDALVTGFASPKDNPYREKQQCSLI